MFRHEFVVSEPPDLQLFVWTHQAQQCRQILKVMLSLLMKATAMIVAECFNFH